MFGFDGQDGLPGKLFIEGFEDGWRAEHQISGVFDLHETPVVGLGEDVEHRTALLGIVIEDAMQVVGREGVGEGLRALPVDTPLIWCSARQPSSNPSMNNFRGKPS